MNIFIKGKKIGLDPRQAIAKGGEADVFDIGQGMALKLFKPANHPDYQGLPQEQQAATARLALHQQKLRLFPSSLPPRVVAPHALATDQHGKTILGYTMPLVQGANVLLKYSDRAFRQTGISHQSVVQIFQDLHTTVAQLHGADVVIGDFNDLNVLVRGTEAYLIDADSFQFGAFPCTVFTARFVDPLLCDRTASQLVLQQPHTCDSDWYAFAVMLMQCLLFVDPYGGVYKPKSSSAAIPHAARPLHRITVFHPEVRYPKPALPYSLLPDELLHHLQQVFQQDKRGEFPRSLLDNLQWTTCIHCGLHHARLTCPHCVTQYGQIAIRPDKTPTTHTGSITVTPLFHTEGIILCAAVARGRLGWLYHHNGQFCREDGTVVLTGALQPQLHWRLQGQITHLAYQGQVITFQRDRPPEKLAVDSLNQGAGTTPQFDSNGTALYWLANGQLFRSVSTAGSSLLPNTPTYMGDILPNQTRFWVGEQFGFGFYQAGELRVAFVFDAEKPGLGDRVQLPPWHGQLIYASCTLSSDHAWLFLTTQSQGVRHYRCVVLHANGTVLATATSQERQQDWLTAVAASGSMQAIGCAVSHSKTPFLLAATDNGIIRVDLQAGQLIHSRTFAETEPFVTSQSHLFIAPQGLYVVNTHELMQLQLN